MLTNVRNSPKNSRKIGKVRKQILDQRKSEELRIAKLQSQKMLANLGKLRIYQKKSEVARKPQKMLEKLRLGSQKLSEEVGKREDRPENDRKCQKQSERVCQLHLSPFPQIVYHARHTHLSKVKGIRKIQKMPGNCKKTQWRLDEVGRTWKMWKNARDSQKNSEKVK